MVVGRMVSLRLPPIVLIPARRNVDHEIGVGGKERVRQQALEVGAIADGRRAGKPDQIADPRRHLVTVEVDDRGIVAVGDAVGETG